MAPAAGVVPPGHLQRFREHARSCCAADPCRPGSSNLIHCCHDHACERPDSDSSWVPSTRNGDVGGVVVVVALQDVDLLRGRWLKHAHVRQVRVPVRRSRRGVADLVRVRHHFVHVHGVVLRECVALRDELDRGAVDDALEDGLDPPQLRRQFLHHPVLLLHFTLETRQSLLLPLVFPHCTTHNSELLFLFLFYFCVPFSFP